MASQARSAVRSQILIRSKIFQKQKLGEIVTTSTEVRSHFLHEAGFVINACHLLRASEPHKGTKCPKKTRRRPTQAPRKRLKEPPADDNSTLPLSCIIEALLPGLRDFARLHAPPFVPRAQSSSCCSQDTCSVKAVEVSVETQQPICHLVAYCHHSFKLHQERPSCSHTGTILRDPAYDGQGPCPSKSLYLLLWRAT